MSRDWTPEELAAASGAMKAAGHMSYDEFREEFNEQMAAGFVLRSNDEANDH